MKYFKLLCLLSAAVLTTPHTYAQQAVNVQDSVALVDLYDSTNGPNWGNNDGWKQGPVSTWYGVTVTDSRVTRLLLPQNNLIGSVPASFGNLENLNSLDFNGSFDLYSNQLRSLPASFGKLTNLTFLDLTSNKLTSLPESFGNLTKLNSLDLSYNQLSSLPTSFGNLSNLQHLSLMFNPLSSLPEFFGNLTSLQSLSLVNSLLNSLPQSFGNLTNLDSLCLSDNTLSSLPESFGNLTKLNFLDFSSNQLSFLPESFGNLTSLQTLVLVNNELSSLPTSFDNLANLQYLNLSDNPLSSLPESFGKLANLQHIQLTYNPLLSSLPKSFGNLTSLQSLDVTYCQLSSLPESFGNLSNLQELYLSNNQLNSLPASLDDLTNLQFLYLDNNKLTFSVIEMLIKKYAYFIYSPQDAFTLAKAGNTLVAAVGGTPENNTFYWYRNEQLDTTIKADSTYTPTKAGTYRVEAQNAIATELILYSDAVAYVPDCEDCTPVSLTCPVNKIVAADKGLCSAVVADIDPVVTGSTVTVTYTLSGATTGRGKGTASGQKFNKGVTTVTYAIANNSSKTCSFTVTVADKGVPVITNVSANPSILWPPNHKLQEVMVNYTIKDNCYALAVLSVKGNDGATSSDWQVVDAHQVRLRAERSGSGNGRTYTITITATDASGNKSIQALDVLVPHDMSVTEKDGNKKNKNEIKVSALPNPSQHYFSLHIESGSNNPVQLRVVDADGRLVEQRQGVNSNTTVQLGHYYRPGVYIIAAMQNGKRATLKLVKQ